jgi:hypothetical protein
MMPLVFELITMLALIALGSVFGRMWEMRQHEIRKRSRQDDKPGFRIPTAQQIADREKCSIRQVNRTITLAFLAPSLVQAAVREGKPL